VMASQRMKKLAQVNIFASQTARARASQSIVHRQLNR
jgi:hypothetical protein